MRLTFHLPYRSPQYGCSGVPAPLAIAAIFVQQPSTLMPFRMLAIPVSDPHPLYSFTILFRFFFTVLLSLTATKSEVCYESL